MEPDRPISDHTTPLYVDVLTVAQRLNLSRHAVYNMLDRGELRGKKMGKRRMVERSSFEEFLPSGVPA